jgi:membrane-associated phospholipid phosphatase
LVRWRRGTEGETDLTQPEMLGLREAAIILFNLALVALFVRLSYSIVQNRDPRFDEQVMLWVRDHSAPWLDLVMRVITHAGDSFFLIALSLTLAWFFFKRFGRKREGLTILLAYALGHGLNSFFKHAFQRERPDLWDMIARPQSYSFPSGHAMSSTVVYAISAFLLETAFPAHRWAIRIVAAILIFLIGASRVYLGVHWPSDVLAGFAAGLVLVFIAYYWYSRADLKTSLTSEIDVPQRK